MFDHHDKVLTAEKRTSLDGTINLFYQSKKHISIRLHKYLESRNNHGRHVI